MRALPHQLARIRPWFLVKGGHGDGKAWDTPLIAGNFEQVVSDRGERSASGATPRGTNEVVFRSTKAALPMFPVKEDPTDPMDVTRMDCLVFAQLLAQLEHNARAQRFFHLVFNPQQSLARFGFPKNTLYVVSPMPSNKRHLVLYRNVLQNLPTPDKSCWCVRSGGSGGWWFLSTDHGPLLVPSWFDVAKRCVDGMAKMLNDPSGTSEASRFAIDGARALGMLDEWVCFDYVTMTMTEPVRVPWPAVESQTS